MRLLKGLLAVLTARWFVTLLGAVLLSLLIWFAGDLVTVAGRTPLAPETTRLVAILVVALLWGVSNLWSQARARKRNDALVRELAPAPSAAPGSAEVAELEKRFANALDQLRKRRIEGRQGGRAWLYDLPWYVMIGAAGLGQDDRDRQRRACGFPLAPAASAARSRAWAARATATGSSPTRRC